VESNIIVTGNETRDAGHLRLEVGSASETVTVTAEAARYRYRAAKSGRDR